MERESMRESRREVMMKTLATRLPGMASSPLHWIEVAALAHGTALSRMRLLICLRRAMRMVRGAEAQVDLLVERRWRMALTDWS